ncbi:MAG: 2-amino-4-hydroxy-6-hydroxymethyldihydropteridine diphosphokinase [Bacteroidaceae bacterium]|nr:2-amino-4-hydroxy-6-hydroxymethyldihydropteridine diphosphokinase [Bacteroidaceae bacterium]
MDRHCNEETTPRPTREGQGGGSLCYLSLGTNLGDKEQNLRRAVGELQKRTGTVVSQSAFFTTEPWGFQSENTFLNLCVGLHTTLSPHELLLKTQEIERCLGRTRKSTDGGYHDRIIDIDLLMCGDQIIDDPDLHIPHPLMAERLFVLQPLAQIAQKQMVPGTRMSVGEMLSALEARS